MQLKAFATGPNGYHWAQKVNNDCELISPGVLRCRTYLLQYSHTFYNRGGPMSE